MQSNLVLGVLALFAVSACAPVASSVPKVSPVSPRTKDSIVNTGRDRDQVKKSVKVVSAEKYEQLEKKLDSDYELLKFDEKDAKLAELRELHAMTGLDLSSANGLEVVVIFVTKSEDKVISDRRAKELELDLSRTKKNRFDLSVSIEGDSGAAWSTIKSDLVSVTIAYRAAKKD